MTEPLSNRPKIGKKELSQGYVPRYFVQHVSMPKIIEIDEKQYQTFKQDPYYRTLQLNWVIGGIANDIEMIDDYHVTTKLKNALNYSITMMTEQELDNILYTQQIWNIG
jgi:hypothetical protein